MTNPNRATNRHTRLHLNPRFESLDPRLLLAGCPEGINGLAFEEIGQFADRVICELGQDEHDAESIETFVDIDRRGRDYFVLVNSDQDTDLFYIDLTGFEVLGWLFTKETDPDIPDVNPIRFLDGEGNEAKFEDTLEVEVFSDEDVTDIIVAGVPAEPFYIEFSGVGDHYIIIDATIPLVSDLDGNGSVDFKDFLVLSSNFGQEVDVTFADGDVNRDGSIDMSDFLILQSEFGS